MCVLSCYGRDKVSQGQSPEFFSLLQYQHLYMLFHVPFQTFLWNKIDTQTISTFYSKIECVRKFFQGHLGANFRFWGGGHPLATPWLRGFWKSSCGKIFIRSFFALQEIYFYRTFPGTMLRGGRSWAKLSYPPPPSGFSELSFQLLHFSCFFFTWFKEWYKKSAESDLIFCLWIKFWPTKISNPLFSIVIIDEWLKFWPTKN